MQLHRIVVQVLRRSNHSCEEINRGLMLGLMCIRCSVYITASKLDVNLGRLGKDNQEQNGLLVEKLCNTY